MISTLIALPYELARLPFATIDAGLARSLPETSVPRKTVDRAIGSADKIAGALLRNGAIARRGTERVDRSDKLVAAARLQAQAETRREAADDVAQRGQQEAAAKRQAAAERVSSGLAEARQAEERGKQKASADAAKKSAAKKAAADRLAADRTETVEQRKKRVAEAAEAKKAAARKTAKQELDDARESKEAAAGARDDAEVLSELADAKKQDRKQD